MANKDLSKMCAVLEAKLEIKQEEINHLRGQVLRLQEALVAKEAPAAYHEMLRNKFVNEVTPEEKQISEQVYKEMKVARELMELTDQPLFSNMDELRSSLMKTVGSPESGPVGTDPNEG